jgi:spore germination protein
MDIHVVQPGETIYSIADKYKVSPTRLIQDNGLIEPFRLVIGQTIVIVYPEQTYTVSEGDSIDSIAKAQGVSLMQLLRNNPFLFDRKFIYPGETLVISYKPSNIKISTNGYTNPYMNRDILRKTLPYLTYLSVFGYRTTAEAEIIGIDDTEIIQIAKEYGVAPIMLLSTVTGQGIGNIEAIYSILNSEALMDQHIEDILNILRAKGYYGINITLQYLNTENTQFYETYITKLVNSLNSENYMVFVTLSPNIIYNPNETAFERIDYSGLGQAANGITLLSYNWGYSYGAPAPVTSVMLLRTFYDYAVTLIPPAKIFLGIPLMGYDWELPYVVGISRANSLTYDTAITLAGNFNATIQFDEISQTPFFEYVDMQSVIPIQHIVWFIDARSIDALVKLVPGYGFQGIGIWNIMYFFSQMWLVINSQYEIEKIVGEDVGGFF